jgi:hypothetical protein
VITETTTKEPLRLAPNPETEMIKALTKLHKSTEQSFAKYGHIYFFMPLAFDHLGTIYGNINAVLVCAYAAAAFAYRNSDA